MKRLTLILTAAILFHGAVQAQSTASAIFLLIAPGAAAGGRGETGVADASDAYASYYNPAALAFLPQQPRLKMGGQGSNWLPNLADDMKYIFMPICYNVPEVGTFGGHVIFLDLGTQMRTGEQGEQLGEFSSNMWAATVSFGTKMSPLSAVGFNVKLIHQNLSAYGAGGEEGSGISTDFAFDFAYYRRHFIFSR
ncbi:MAG: PorV/PorQ family protein, partial [Calditrichaeota bacterium]|nr:PorV/PorQ family protein [Calditrichota bacterium]